MQNGNVNGEDDEEYQLFLSQHSPALKAARIPPIYWKSLHLKLASEVNAQPSLQCQFHSVWK